MKALKRLIILGLVLTLIGGVIFTVALVASDFKFDKLSGIRLIENEYVQSADTDINEIRLDFGTTDVNIVFDENATLVTAKYNTKVDKNGKALTEVTITHEDGVLSLREKVMPRKSIFIFDFTSPRVTLTLPASSDISITVETDTGDVTLGGNGSLASLSISIDTGDVSTSSAAIAVTDKVSIETDTGDVRLGNLGTVSLFAKTDTGDITLCEPILVTDSVTLSTDTGEIEINAALTAGRVAIETDTGAIDAEDGKIDATEVYISTDTGDIDAVLTGELSEYTVTVKKGIGDSNISNQTGGDRKLEVSSSVGDIDISFKVNVER